MTVDPAHRLVADRLEADWNGTLRQLADAEAEYERASRTATPLAEEQRSAIQALATDFPRLWSDPATPARERKRVTRLVIEDVTITKTEEIRLEVRFRGGATTSLVVPVPLMSYQQHQTKPETLAALDRLLETHTDAESAEALNEAGHRSGTGQAFTGSIVLHLRRANGLPSHLERLRARGLLNARELADRLEVSVSTVKAWHRAGLLVSQRANDKNIRLFEPPTPNDPRLTKRQGSSLKRRASTDPLQGGAV
jgi:DNA-binding transcriptional regulator YiaG